MRRAAGIVAACALVGSCSHDSRPFDRSVPIGSRSTGEGVADVPVRGHVITLQTRHGAITGELLAVGPSELMMLAENDGRIVRFSEIQDVEVTLYPSRSAATAVWTGVGTASAVTHGLWALISMPVWLISGVSVSVAESENVRVEGVQLDKLYQYARFPQGMPDVARPGPGAPTPRPLAPGPPDASVEVPAPESPRASPDGGT